MPKNHKKMFPALTCTLVALTGVIHAEVDNAQMRNLENRVSALEQRKNAGGMINPPGRPQVRDGVDLFLFGEVLLWNAHQNGMPIAVVNESHHSHRNLAHSKVKNVHSDWTVGFRVGAGYNLPHDSWDLNFAWARLFTHGDTHTHAKHSRQVYPSRVHPGDRAGDRPFAKDSSHWSLHFDQLDLDLGREFFVSKWLTLRPNFGLRTDWIEQNWRTKFKHPSGDSSSGHKKLELEYKDKWWGLGLEGGLDTQWMLGCGWSLFGNMATAILYGFHDLDFKDEDSTRFVDLDDVYRISHPILDLQMGVRYDHMFANDRFHLGLQVGWEHHVYFSQNQFPVFTDSNAKGTFVQNQGDLTFQGWTFATRFDF